MHGEKDGGRTSEDEGMEWVRLLHCSWGMKSCKLWIHRWATSSPTGVRPKPKGDATPCVLVQSNLHLYTQKYLSKYLEDAVLNDPSVGKKFIGHQGIREYFTSYFIGYKTKTKLVDLEVNGNKAHMEVEFKGEFPEGKLGGVFDFTFKDGKIAKVKADLLR